MTWTLVLIVAVAFAIIVFAFKVRAVRFGSRWIKLSALFVALVAAVAGLALAGYYYDGVLEQARGDSQWAEDSSIRLLLVVSSAAVIAYWVWVVIKSKSRDD